MGAIVHVISRFVDYRFVLDDEARRCYLARLCRALPRTDWRLIAYALMSSHIHLAFLMGHEELRAWVHALNLRFALWVNRRLRLSNQQVLGHVFADRPTTRVIPPSRARLLIAYLHRNPLEAGVVSHPQESAWTSHGAYVGVAEPVAGLDVLLGLELSGFEPTIAGRAAFDRFVARTSVSTHDLIERSPVETLPTQPASPSVRPNDLVRIACDVSRQSMSEVMGASRRLPIVMVRRVSLVAWLELGGTAAEMARALGVGEPSASRLLSRPHAVSEVRGLVERVLSRVDEAA